MNGDALLKPSRLAKNLSLGLLSLGLSLPCIGWGQFCGQNHASAVRNIHASAHVGGRETPAGDGGKQHHPNVALTRHGVFAIRRRQRRVWGVLLSDLWALRDTLIYALQPDVLMIYEGDNDLVDGVPEHDILATAEQLIHELSARLPQTAVVMVAPKASPARYHFAPAYLRLNQGLKQGGGAPRGCLGGLLGRTTHERGCAARRLVRSRRRALQRPRVRRVGA